MVMYSLKPAKPGANWILSSCHVLFLFYIPKLTWNAQLQFIITLYCGGPNYPGLSFGNHLAFPNVNFNIQVIVQAFYTDYPSREMIKHLSHFIFRVHLVSAAPAKLARQLILANLLTTRLLTAQARTQPALAGTWHFISTR